MSYRKDILSRRGYLAGEDRRRARELEQHLRDPRSRIILAARGGFGTQRLLPLLKVSSPRRKKIIVGSSDLTVLLNYVWKKFRWKGLYGPMLISHLNSTRAVRRFLGYLQNPARQCRRPLKATAILRPGRAEGRLVGGCLTLLLSSLGTPWEIDTRGAILFLEDTHEEAYAVDRMLTQLEQAGKFRGVRGIVLGTFRQRSVLFPKSVQNVFREKFRRFRGPVLWGLWFGHCPEPLPIPFGGRGRIRGQSLEIVEGAF